MNNRAKAFTLIELLVVIAVIGFLAAVVLVAVNRSRRSADASKVMADHNQIRKAFQIWMLDTGATLLPRQTVYGTTGAVCGNDEPAISATDLFSNVQNLSGWSGPYLGSTPKTPWGVEYTYDNDGDTWPGSNAGVNLYLQWCNSRDGQRVQDFAPKIDARLDNSDGNSSGTIRWSSSTSSGSLRLLLERKGK